MQTGLHYILLCIFKMSTVCLMLCFQFAICRILLQSEHKNRFKMTGLYLCFWGLRPRPTSGGSAPGSRWGTSVPLPQTSKWFESCFTWAGKSSTCYGLATEKLRENWCNGFGS